MTDAAMPNCAIGQPDHAQPQTDAHAPIDLHRWLLVGAQAALFGGLVFGFGVYRLHHPEVFEFGQRYTDPLFAGIGAGILLAGSVAVALARRAAQRGQSRQAAVLMGVVLLMGAGFLGLKVAEYESRWRYGIVWDDWIPQHARDASHERQAAAQPAAPEAAPAEAQPAAFTPSVDTGRDLFMGTCAGCHGPDAMGLPNQGVALVANTFVQGKDDAALLKFLQVGRQPFEKDNTTGIAMPPRGGNPTLNDEKLQHIIAYLRTLQDQPAAVADAASADGAAPAPAANAAPALFVHHSVIPPAETGPLGVASRFRVDAITWSLELRRAAVQRFFAAFFVVTVPHALLILLVVGLVGWLAVELALGRSSEASGRLRLLATAWHGAAAAWMVIFPLAYLLR